MTKVLLLVAIMLFGAVFLVIPRNNNPPMYALFLLDRDATISIQSYVYFIFEHFQLMALCYIIASEAKTYRLSCKTFFWLQVADFSDYLLSYNAIWFNLGLLPVSMNLMSVAVFGFVVLYERIKDND